MSEKDKKTKELHVARAGKERLKMSNKRVGSKKKRRTLWGGKS